MPSQLHDVFIARVVEEIQNRLRAFTDAESRSRAFAQKIKHNGSGRLDLPSEDNNGGTTIRRQPDATFKHCDAHWPGVVIEVSYSQKTKAIPHLLMITYLKQMEAFVLSWGWISMTKPRKAQSQCGVRIT